MSVFKKNLGFEIMKTINEIHVVSEYKEVSNFTKDEVVNLKFAPTTLVDVERCFS